MIFNFGKYVIDVDVEKTRKANEELKYTCTCSACENFRRYAEVCPNELKKFFKSLGLDISNPGEVYGVNVTENGLLHYGGWWYLCGSVVNTDYRIKAREDGMNAVVYDGYEVAENFKVTFGAVFYPVPKSFPKPRFTMEMEADAPIFIERVKVYYGN